MADSIYAMFEKYLFDHKDEKRIDAFICAKDIDLSKASETAYPTVNSIKQSIHNAGFEISLEMDNNFYGESGWCCGIKGHDGMDIPVSVDIVSTHDEEITEAISFPMSDSPVTVKFLLELSKICGQILFVCETGNSALITQEKTVDQIIAELNE